MMRSFAHIRQGLSLGCLTLAVLLTPLLALADEGSDPDARLEGYNPSVALKDGGIGGSVVLLLVLIAITMGVMFINAKRSHLD